MVNRVLIQTEIDYEIKKCIINLDVISGIMK